jgi:hypothetical protein
MQLTIASTVGSSTSIVSDYKDPCSCSFEVHPIIHGSLHTRQLTASPKNNDSTPSDTRPIRVRIRNKNGDLREFTELIRELTLAVEEKSGVSMKYERKKL